MNRKRGYEYYKERQEKAKANPPPPDTSDDADVVSLDTPDPYVGTPEVIGLNDRWFYQFLQGKEAAMIFFYDPTTPESYLAKEQFREAAQNTQREGHVYGAVDCLNNSMLCMKEGFFKVSLPAYKLYSYGQLVGRYYDNMRSEDIKRFAEVSPVPDKPRVLQKLCKALHIPWKSKDREKPDKTVHNSGARVSGKR